MNIKFFFTVLILLSQFLLTAAPVNKLPYQISQPNGQTYNVFVSGDEFFNYLHDEAGYTIIQEQDGYFYYALRNTKGGVIASDFIYGTVDPKTHGIPTHVKISKEKYLEKVKNKQVAVLKSAPDDAYTFDADTLNNIVIYIQFADDSDYKLSRSDYDEKFNAPNEVSLYNYYKEVSYEQLNIISTHFPKTETDKNLAYVAPQSRSFFQPFNATTNTSGYKDGQEDDREHLLIINALKFLQKDIEETFTAEDLDKNNDGLVDNVTFIIRGENDSWSDLLWAHRWSLFSGDFFLHDKKVYDYIFQPEAQVDVKTLCHEVFHALGAPDLYHYNDGGLDISPAGSWDLMNSGFGHMLAYMKYRYTSWMDTIPVIENEGYYELNPLSDSTNNAYRINSPYSEDEYFVVEYRKKQGLYEKNLSGSGIIISRINTLMDGEGNASGPPDEVYVFRPGGTNTANGTVSQAHFSSSVGRTEFHVGTRPKPFLQDGTDGGISISEITEPAEKISFKLGIVNVANPSLLEANTISHNEIELDWKLNLVNDFVMVAVNDKNEFGEPNPENSYTVGSEIEGGGTVVAFSSFKVNYNHADLDANTTYYYKAWSYDGTEFSTGTTTQATTNCEKENRSAFVEDFESTVYLKDLCWRTYQSYDYNGGLNPDYLKEVDYENGEITWNITSSDTSNYDSENYVKDGNNSILISARANGFNWLVSPYTYLHGDVNHKLVFDLWYKNAPDTTGNMKYSNLHVLVSKNDGRWQSLMEYNAIENNELESNEYEKQISIGLSEYKNSTVRIAFVHENTDGWPIAIDNVFIDNHVSSSDLFSEQITAIKNPIDVGELIHFRAPEKALIRVYDINGRLVFSSQLDKDSEETYQFNKRGTFFVESNNSKTSHIQKVIVK